MNSLEALGVFRVIDSMLIRETMFNVLNEATVYLTLSSFFYAIEL